MSSPIMPIGSPADSHKTTHTPPAGGSLATTPVAEQPFRQHGADIDAGRGEPPAHVMEQVWLAGARHDQLLAEGWELRFGPGSPGGRIAVTLAGAGGGNGQDIPLSEAFRIAAGGPLL